MKIPMSFTSIKLAAVFFALLATSCNQEEEALTQPKNLPDDKVTALIALSHKPGYTQVDAQALETAYKALSYQELVSYREVEIEQIIKEYGDTKQVRELMAQNLAAWKEFNQKSIERYGVPSNQASNMQVNTLLTTIDQDRITALKSARTQADCPVIFSNAALGYGGNGLFPVAAVREVDLGNKNDCDCELAFNTSDGIYFKLQPYYSTAAIGLLSSTFALASPS